MLPKVSDLLLFDDYPNADAVCICVHLKPSATSAEFARTLGIDIVHRLANAVPQEFERWYAHLNGTPALDETDKTVLCGLVGADFVDAGNTIRLQGAVVEHLWAAVAAELDGGWGVPVHVEHDHFTVIDHGPDGLSLYEIGQPSLGFRLWESKSYDADASITNTVTTAANQLAREGVEYLSRLTKPLQLNPDPSIANLAATIIRAWVEGDDTKAVGISVGHPDGTTIPARPFIGMGRAFTFTDKNRREGVFLELPDFANFAQAVAGTVMNGLT